MMLSDRIAESLIHHAKHDPLVQLFIWRAVGPAQKSERVTGIPAAVTIAQGIIESAAGGHHGGDANNYFGIKAPPVKGKRFIGAIAIGAKRLMTTEVIGGVVIIKPDYFRTYKDMSDSFEDHGVWIKNNRNFKAAVAEYSITGDADQFAKGLAIGGYATAMNYSVSIIAIMRKHVLYRFDLKRPIPRAR